MEHATGNTFVAQYANGLAGVIACRVASVVCVMQCFTLGTVVSKVVTDGLGAAAVWVGTIGGVVLVGGAFYTLCVLTGRLTRIATTGVAPVALVVVVQTLYAVVVLANGSGSATGGV